MRETQRVDKLLSNSGFGTRKEVRKLIKSGAVKVDGTVITDAGIHIDPVNSLVEVGGEVVKYREYIYVMMNKPKGVISATYDKRHMTVVDILPEEYKCFNLFPVGRLDIDTEGLLVLTNDGQFAHEVLSPKKHVPKKYHAIIEGTVTQEDVRRFKEGVVLDDGYKTLPAELNILNSEDTSHVEVVIYEGKFHQIKRMFQAVGKRVKYLKRIEMGKLKLDSTLLIGECRELSKKEVALLKISNDSDIN
ncbi:pseudouridine synthase [Acetivibrio saccincola]|uniref:Pseudouridine synthase n=1 Tax=Acetivibrio saccincola TaxID=1677857 RepID=A0A2K9E3N9_9FIRM|nr:pseudouridine synthase [Acetivibrio saccincola]AUG58342.1 Ribosomal large subunit pseudouridine synthase B [Acetivibrio saccincola]NLW27139.1 rRNA pseudouridine synthase [Acetivibrio saccincola]PQQ66439.1 16S rRNA pseudouridine(516) synthase [Acetivibrio saccincola]HOA97099.1 pseudouridine synthase [Acetivibrio saccincola]HQD27918.1 pseudouridine synthase [Acetivibrio saccincola]